MIQVSNEDVSYNHVETFAWNEGELMDLGVAVEKLVTGDNPYFESPHEWGNEDGIACFLFGSTLHVPETGHDAKNVNKMLYAHCDGDDLKEHLNKWYRIPEDVLDEVI